METTLTDRGQTAVPARIRRHFNLRPGQKLEWMEDGGVICVLPIPKNPIRAFRGSSAGGGSNRSLLKSRREDARRRA
ncbi:MAG TPA: AbrB/MazE/SpoVT family DNA-binding domain-containing protein [Elusimicrobiota bacterium]|nr:AbrB/MazE/SpoVT family DNA-binding domain-containing protein [Elusimicrobiota bacterium]